MFTASSLRHDDCFCCVIVCACACACEYVCLRPKQVNLVCVGIWGEYCAIYNLAAATCARHTHPRAHTRTEAHMTN